MFGASYAPGDANATYSWFTEWGCFTERCWHQRTATVNPADVIEKARKHIIANAGDNADEYRIMTVLTNLVLWLYQSSTDCWCLRKLPFWPKSLCVVVWVLIWSTVSSLTRRNLCENISGYVTAGDAVIFPKRYWRSDWSCLCTCWHLCGSESTSFWSLCGIKNLITCVKLKLNLKPASWLLTNVQNCLFSQLVLLLNNLI